MAEEGKSSEKSRVQFGLVAFLIAIGVVAVVLAFPVIILVGPIYLAIYLAPILPTAIVLRAISLFRSRGRYLEKTVFLLLVGIFAIVMGAFVVFM
jgi:hypothetical protein